VLHPGKPPNFVSKFPLVEPSLPAPESHQLAPACQVQTHAAQQGLFTGCIAACQSDLKRRPTKKINRPPNRSPTGGMSAQCTAHCMVVIMPGLISMASRSVGHITNKARLTIQATHKPARISHSRNSLRDMHRFEQGEMASSSKRLANAGRRPATTLRPLLVNA
jgi:hypothetical protein